MSFSGFMDFLGQVGPLGAIAIFGIPIAIVSMILVGGIKGVSSLFGNTSNQNGGSLVKKFRKNIGICCLLVGLAVAVPLTGLVKNYM